MHDLIKKVCYGINLDSKIGKGILGNTRKLEYIYIWKISKTSCLSLMSLQYKIFVSTIKMIIIYAKALNELKITNLISSRGFKILKFLLL